MLFCVLAFHAQLRLSLVLSDFTTTGAAAAPLHLSAMAAAASSSSSAAAVLKPFLPDCGFRTGLYPVRIFSASSSSSRFQLQLVDSTAQSSLARSLYCIPATVPVDPISILMHTMQGDAFELSLGTVFANAAIKMSDGKIEIINESEEEGDYEKWVQWGQQNEIHVERLESSMGSQGCTLLRVGSRYLRCLAETTLPHPASTFLRVLQSNIFVSSTIPRLCAVELSELIPAAATADRSCWWQFEVEFPNPDDLRVLPGMSEESFCKLYKSLGQWDWLRAFARPCHWLDSQSPATQGTLVQCMENYRVLTNPLRPIEPIMSYGGITGGQARVQNAANIVTISQEVTQTISTLVPRVHAFRQVCKPGQQVPPLDRCMMVSISELIRVGFSIDFDVFQSL